MTQTNSTLLAIMLFLAGCGDTDKSADTGEWDGDDGTPADDDPSDQDADADADGDDTGTGGDDTGTDDGPFNATDGPCADGGWGTITDPATTHHFWGGNESNSIDGAESLGDMNAPFTSWNDLEAARTADPNLVITAIGLWGGEHTIPTAAITEFATNNIPVLGCGSAEVLITLDAGAGADPEAPLIAVGMGMEATLNGLELHGTGTSPVVSVTDGGSATLADMQIVAGVGAPILKAEGNAILEVTGSVLAGGTTGIWTSGGTSSLTLNNVEISSPQGAGIWTSGGTSSLIDVQISGVTAMPGITSGVGGWGIVANGGDLVAHNVTVDGAVGAGLVAAVDGVVSIKDVTIQNISGSSEGNWGRGIYIEGIGASGYVNMDTVTVDNVYETGIFIQDLGSTDLQNITMTNVHSHTSFYGEPVGGDGLVIVQTNEDDATIDPSVVSAQLLGSNSFTGITRAGIIAHGSHLQLTVPMDLEAGDERDGTSIFSQGYGVVEFVSGSDGGDDTGTPSSGLVTECGSDDSYDLDCDGFDFSSSP